MDVPDTAPTSTSGIDGGMIAPLMEVAMVRAALKSREKPLFSIMLTWVRPSAAMSAIAEPEQPPNSMLATMFT